MRLPLLLGRRMTQDAPVDPICVLLIGRPGAFLEAVQENLNDEADLSVLGQAHTATEVTWALQRGRADVAVIDNDPLGEGAGEINRALLEEGSCVPAVVITDREDVQTLRSAVLAGAMGFVPTTASITELIEATRIVGGGGSTVPPHLLTTVLQDLFLPPQPIGSPLTVLTSRQAEVLQRLVAGGNPATIAADMGLSVHTIRTHVKRILRRLGVHTSLEAVTVARRGGMRPPLT
jgi:two-component system, NarL family, response regulator LiaR